ncbi:MAG: hypothetical protein N2205_02205 [Candidatus Caldatribacterium sp.]|nr:hypothetical protein [Candidatus Caldatribacterium sp.]
MTDQTAASLYRVSFQPEEVQITSEEREILWSLACRVWELSELPEQREKRELWYRHNALEETRPVVFCDPENGWNEIIPPSSLACRGRLARHWEMSLRKEIFWGACMGDDKVIEPYFDVPYVYEETGWGLEERIIKTEERGSYRWDPPLKDYREMDKLHFPEIRINEEASERLFVLAQEVFEGILFVRRKTTWWWTLGMTWTLVTLRGMEQVMLDMYDHPWELHTLMAFLRDGHLAKLDFLEKQNLLALNNDGTYVGSGGFGYTHELPQSDFDGVHVRTIDMWGFAESQETCYVSPGMFEEFIFPYQYALLERFGLNCYGCCEPLHSRWHIVRRFPRLRRISVSPWADLRKMAEYLQDAYIYSLKPNPAYLATPQIDREYIRKTLREALEITRGCRVEVIMKDNHTIGGDPENVTAWCRIAKKEAERVSGL